MKFIKMFVVGLFSVILCAISTQVMASVENNTLAPDFALMDSNGNLRNLSDFRGKHVVLEWVNYQCPFVVKHYKSGNMQKLQKAYTEKDVIWLSINSSAEGKQGYYEPDEINEIIENSNASPTAYLIDTGGKIGKTYGAKTTPHMYVISPEGNLIYQGAIDNIPSFDSNDIPNAQNYVALAIDQSMNGEELATPLTKSYGCSVKY